MNASNALHFLQQLPDLESVARVYKFSAWRRRKDGSTEEVEISIFDRGTEYDGPRFSCEGTTTDGRRASGNSHDDVEAAIAMVHWWDLDKPAVPRK